MPDGMRRDSLRRIAVLAASLTFILSAVFTVGPALSQQPPGPQQAAAANRTKLLTSPGVFGVFAMYKISPDYYRLSAAERRGAAAEVTATIARHAERVIVDAYLTRGLSGASDYFLRVHSDDLSAAQAFLVDFRATRIGQHSVVTENLFGVTKALNYITKQKSPELNAALGASPYAGDPPRYAIVIPTKKSAEWWNLSTEQRLKEMETHTQPTLAYLPLVKRKLYHASGLADADFVTYFETNDLTAFNELIIALLSVPENKYNLRLGNPTTVGTIRSVEDVVKALSVTP